MFPSAGGALLSELVHLLPRTFLPKRNYCAPNLELRLWKELLFFDSGGHK